MSKVSGLSELAKLLIAKKSFVDAKILNGNLILKRYDGDAVNAGSVGGGGGGGGAGLYDPAPNQSRNYFGIHVPNIFDGSTYSPLDGTTADQVVVETGDYLSVKPAAKGLYSLTFTVYSTGWTLPSGLMGTKPVYNVNFYSPYGDEFYVPSANLPDAALTLAGPSTRKDLLPFLRDSDVLYVDTDSTTEANFYTWLNTNGNPGTQAVDIKFWPILLLP